MQRLWTIIGVMDVARSFAWYQSLLGHTATQPAHDHFGQIVDTDGTVLLCLHGWGDHAHPSLATPDHARPGNGLLLFFRIDDFDQALDRARGLAATLEEEPHLNPATGTMEFALRDPDGYYVMVSAQAAGSEPTTRRHRANARSEDPSALEEKLISRNFPGVEPKTSGLALDLNPGDGHYRAYVGPPKDYDLVSAMAFNLLTSIGLRQHHRVLDIGCGSLRIGRLLIPYLNEGHYFGVDPNKWLVEDGIANEIGQDLVRIKKPCFSFLASMDDFKDPLNLDYAIAQSIFSHCGEDLIRHWLSQASFHLTDDAAIVATFVDGTEDYRGHGWVYPGCVTYRPQTLARFAAEFDLDFRVLDWVHPRQTWALFSKKDYDKSLIDGGPISWNRFAATMAG